MAIIILTLLISYIFLFLLSLYRRDNTVVDEFWGIGFILIAWLSYILWDGGMLPILVTSLVTLWWVRLSYHLISRQRIRKHEDPRYALWREQWGSGWYFYIRSFLQVFFLQMILMLIVATPILITNLWYVATPTWLMNDWEFHTGRIGILIIIGVIISLFGLIFESIWDRQLARFVTTKQPWQIMQTGLYRYTRHPNYFGESMFWLGISLISLPFSYIGLVGWLSITGLLLFVSGVPMQEARYIWRPEWEEYKSRTSVFIPWWPKNRICVLNEKVRFFICRSQK